MQGGILSFGLRPGSCIRHAWLHRTSEFPGSGTHPRQYSPTVLRKTLVRLTNARISVQNIALLTVPTETSWSIPTVLCESELPCSCPALLDGLSLVPAWLHSRNC